MAAIVEDDVGGHAAAIEAVYFIDEVESDGVGGGVLPVGGHGVPEDGVETEAAGDAQGLGSAGSVGRTKVADGQAGDLLQSLGGAVNLLIDAAGGGQCQVEMGPGMVADEVTGGDDLADEGGFCLSAAADEKKGGADTAAGEKFEEAGGPDGVGAVVEGEGQLAGARRSDERGAEELRGGPQGGIGEASRRQTESGCCAETGGDSSRQGENMLSSSVARWG